jgi:hypothetical protein
MECIENSAEFSNTHVNVGREIMKEKKKRSPKASFISGLISASGLVAFFVLMGRGPSYGLEQLGTFFQSAIVTVPIMLVFGISSLISGFRVESEGRFKWWLIPGGTTLALVIGYPIFMILWVQVSELMD